MLILLFALIGLLLNGFRGLFYGAFIGYLLGFALRTLLRRGLGRIQSQFTDSIFAVVGALSKADGVVSPEEIRVAEELFVQFQLNDEQIQSAKAAFQRGKAADFDLDAEVLRFRTVARSNATLQQTFLDVLLRTVMADGTIDPKEREMLLRIVRDLGMTERDLAQLEALLRAAAGGGASPSSPPSADLLDDAYRSLGVSKSASESELKRAYRKLIVENHPDKLAAKGVPPGMLKMAEEKTRELNVAYGLIKKSRGMS